MRTIVIPFAGGGRGPGPALAPAQVVADLRAAGWSLAVTDAFAPVTTDARALSRREVGEWMRHARTAVEARRDEAPLLILGGDHTISVGSFAGLMDDTPLGCIWLDAHPDLNNDETTPSGLLHGMALRICLGQGDQRLALIGGVKPKVRPQHTALIGLRSIDPGEHAFHQRYPELLWLTAGDARARGTAKPWQP